MSNPIFLFIWKYLAGPVVADAQNAATASWNGVVASTGYNQFNTFAWALIALGVAYGFYMLFDKIDVEFDLETVLYTLPYVLLGGMLRFLEDTGIIPFPLSIIAITPVIYIFIALLYLGSLGAAYKFKREQLDSYIGLAGAVFLFPIFLATILQLFSLGFDPVFLGYSLFIPTVLTGVFYLYIRQQEELNNLLYTLAGFSQFFGGTVSMMSVVRGGEQKQLLAQFSTDIFGPAGILIVKTALLVLAVLILKDVDDVRTEALVILALIVIGLATGLRVMLRTATGV